MKSAGSELTVSTSGGATPLRRILGTTTALCVGLGVAIGSGIFRTPGEIAKQLNSGGWIIAAWIGGGLFTLAAGLVSAELGTRLPRAGGEYAFLREAYGEFVGFFYGWAYTFFGIGVGVAIMAVAFGEVTCEFLGLSHGRTPMVAAAGLAVVTTINCLGLRAGAGTQNVLTFAKVAALAGVAVAAFFRGGGGGVRSHPVSAPVLAPSLTQFAAGLGGALWAYDGATDSVKMAEEVHDVRRALPRALISASLLVTALYVLVNLAFLHVMLPSEMAQSTFVGNDAMKRVAGPPGATALAGLTAMICFGAMISTQLSSIRVTYALSRDGLGFEFLSKMSAAQSPIAALIAVGLISTVFASIRGFEQVLSIYLFSTSILFSLNYLSLLILRRRDDGHPPGVFRCPGAPLLVAALIGVQACIAYQIAATSPKDTLGTCLLLAIIAVIYIARREWVARRRPAG